MPKNAILAGIVLGVTSLATPLAAQSCLTTPERDAVQVRLLQTELMVAALSCGGTDYPSHYNEFVRKFSPELVSHSKSLKAFFDRRHSGRSRSELDSFITRIANVASLRSMQTAEFCQKSGVLISEVMALTPRELAAFSATKPLGDADHVAGCSEPPRGTQRTASVRSSKQQ